MSLRSGETAVKAVSVNVGTPREVRWKDKLVTTGMFKAPVDVRVTMRRLNLDGDRQADLRVHGGPSKAVYTYPSEHYAYWQREFPGMELPWGMFGENLTTLALLERDVRIGDHVRVGSADVIVTEPRMPCYKLGLKFGREDIIKRFPARHHGIVRGEDRRSRHAAGRCRVGRPTPVVAVILSTPP